MNTNSKSKRYAATTFGAMAGVLAVAAAAFASSAVAAPAANGDSPQARYQREVARCNSGQSGESKATCLREAGAALQEARRGDLTHPGDQAYEQNKLARCKSLPAADQADCINRMTKGTTSGSVEGGGVLREYRETVVGPGPGN